MKTIEQRIRDLEAKMQTAVRFAPGGGAVAAARLAVGGGASIQQIARYTFNWSPGAVPANSIWNSSFTVPGLAVNDWVYVVPPATSNCPPCAALVTAPGNIQVMFVNAYTTSQTPAAGTYTVIAVRI